MRVLKKVSSEQEKKNEWAKYWIEEGFKGLEKMLESTAGKYCYGDQVTMADCVLVPQVCIYIIPINSITPFNNIFFCRSITQLDSALI